MRLSVGQLGLAAVALLELASADGDGHDKSSAADWQPAPVEKTTAADWQPACVPQTVEVTKKEVYTVTETQYVPTTEVQIQTQVVPSVVVSYATETVTDTVVVSATVVNENTVLNTVTQVDTAVNTVTQVDTAVNTITQVDTAVQYQTVTVTAPCVSTSKVLTGLVTCESRIVNPTYTPSAPLPSNYLWGCPPGTICTPPQVDCNFEADQPADTYLCAPEECKPVQPLPSLDEIKALVNQGPTCAWLPPAPGYFNLNPIPWGLSYAIFDIYGQPTCAATAAPPPPTSTPPPPPPPPPAPPVSTYSPPPPPPPTYSPPPPTYSPPPPPPPPPPPSSTYSPPPPTYSPPPPPPPPPPSSTWATWAPAPEKSTWASYSPQSTWKQRESKPAPSPENTWKQWESKPAPSPENTWKQWESQKAPASSADWHGWQKTESYAAKVTPRAVLQKRAMYYPEGCYQFCNYAAEVWQSVGKQPDILCAADGDYSAALGALASCSAASSDGDPIRVTALDQASSLCAGGGASPAQAQSETATPAQEPSSTSPAAPVTTPETTPETTPATTPATTPITIPTTPDTVAPPVTSGGGSGTATVPPVVSTPPASVSTFTGMADRTVDSASSWLTMFFSLLTLLFNL